MGSTPISAACLLTSLAAVVLLETAGWAVGAGFPLPHLWLVAATRTAQASTVIALAVIRYGGLSILGLEKSRLRSGCRKGLIWSAGFAAAAGVVYLALLGIGPNPLAWVRAPLPPDISRLAAYFIVGGVVAPVAEEIVFRGLIFGYLRRWGIPAAVLISTALFGALHLPAIPVTQIVGGVVFALAYHRSGSLAAPIIIHVLGNLAIFTLSLPRFH